MEMILSVPLFMLSLRNLYAAKIYPAPASDSLCAIEARLRLQFRHSRSGNQDLTIKI